jgi:hypothetical protein
MYSRAIARNFHHRSEDNYAVFFAGLPVRPEFPRMRCVIGVNSPIAGRTENWLVD